MRIGLSLSITTVQRIASTAILEPSITLPFESTQVEEDATPDGLDEIVLTYAGDEPLNFLISSTFHGIVFDDGVSERTIAELEAALVGFTTNPYTDFVGVDTITVQIRRHGEATWVDEQQITVEVTPLMPQSFDVVPTPESEPSSLTLAWTDSSVASHVQIEANYGSGFELIDTIVVNTNTYNDTTPDPETAIDYRIRAFDTPSGLFSDWVTDTGTTIAEPGFASDPTEVQITEGDAVDLTAMVVNYDGVGFLTLNIDDVQVTEGSTAADINGFFAVGTFNVAGLAAGDHTVPLQVKRTGQGDWSSEVDIVVDVIPQAPSDLTGAVNAGGDPFTEILLAWTDNTTTATSIQVQKSDAGAGSWSTVEAVMLGVMNLTVTGLNPDNAYDFRIRSVHGGSGLASDWVTITDIFTGPAAPTVEIVDDGGGTCTITITNNSGVATHWEIESQLDSGGWLGFDLGILPFNSPIVDNTGYPPDSLVEYRARVKFTDASGDVWSDFGSDSVLMGI